MPGGQPAEVLPVQRCQHESGIEQNRGIRHRADGRVLARLIQPGHDGNATGKVPTR